MGCLYKMVLGIAYCIEPITWLLCMKSSNRASISRFAEASLIFGYYILTILKQYSLFQECRQELMLGITVLFLIYLLLASYLWFQKEWKEMFLCLGVFLICSISTELLSVSCVMLCLDCSISELSKLSTENVACTISSKILLVILCKIIFWSKKLRETKEAMTGTELLPLLLLAVLLEIPFATAFHFSGQFFRSRKDLYFYLGIQIYMICLLVYIVHIIYRYQVNMKELQIELQEKKKIGKLTAQLAQMKHDLSFLTMMMFHFVQMEQYDELKEFMGGMVQEVKEVEDVFFLPDKSVSHTLNLIAQQMKEKEIQFEHVIMVSDFVLSPNDLSRLLFNMLKNAMEAVEELEKENRKVTLEIGSREHGYHINCLNPYRKRYTFQRELFSTSKEDMCQHGKGMSIMKKIVEGYGGVMKIQVHDTLFEIDCFIPNRERCDAN